MIAFLFDFSQFIKEMNSLKRDENKLETELFIFQGVIKEMNSLKRDENAII